MQFSVSNFFTGLALVGVGTLTLIYNYQIVNAVGRQDWIENRLGGGTTYLAFKMLSIITVFVGLLFATGLGGAFFTWVFSPLRNLFRPGA